MVEAEKEVGLGEGLAAEGEAREVVQPVVVDMEVAELEEAHWEAVD